MDLINKNRGSNLISDKKEDREKKMKWEEKNEDMNIIKDYLTYPN